MMVLISPVLAILLHLPLHSLPALILSLLAGSISLIFIGAIGAALTVGLRQGGVLLSLIILPLYVPVLILGVACVQAAAIGMPVASYLALLLSLALFVLILAPLAIIAGLRINLDAG